MERLDLVVIGAGFQGLAAAKAYLQLNPGANIAVIDSSMSVGGVWSHEKRYPGLQSNNLLGTYEFSDFPMDAQKYGLTPKKAIPGRIVQQYLHDYAEKFGVLDGIRLQTKVESAEHQGEGGWVLTLQSGKDGFSRSSQVFTSKLIVATGLTSNPAAPVFKGMEGFGGALFHPRDVSTYEAALPAAKRVCVYGGTKSAYDAVYAFGTRGAQVDWVIRESGHGPAWMAPPFVTPFKRWLEKLPHTRFLTWFSPCIWSYADGYPTIRGLLHNTRIGRWFVNQFWSVLANDVTTLNNYDAHPETSKLKPWTNPMFVASSIGILNYETDLYDLVRKGVVKVHVADIESLGPREIHLSTGKSLPADAIVACTGWRPMPAIKFLPADLDLGLPTTEPLAPSRIKLTQKVDQQILNTFPRLNDQASRNTKPSPRQVEGDEENLSSYSLYRFMVPPSITRYRDFAVSGALMSFSTPLVAQTQALWIVAYLSKSIKLSLPSTSEDMEYEAVLHNRFGKWRYPLGFGEKFPDFVFDAVPYIDLLLGDLGLKKWRKNGRVAEWLEAYGPQDYKGLVEEFQSQGQPEERQESRKDL